MTKNDTTIEQIIMSEPVEEVAIVEPSPQEPLKRRRGRPHKEMGTKQTDDPEYFKMYYRENLRKLQPCPNCDKLISKGFMLKHTKSNCCKKLQEYKITLLI